MNSQVSKVDELFDHSDYRAALRAELLAKKAALPNRYSFQRLADACKVQKTYLSTALAGKGHLSRDQLFLAAEFLGLAGAALDYLELLYEFQRSSSTARRRRLETQLDRLRRAARRTEHHVDADIINADTADLSAYYLDPIVPIVHMFVTIPRFAADSRSIAAALRMGEERINRALEILLRLKIAAFENGAFRSRRDSLHLPESSPVYASHRTLLRMAALDRQQQLGPDDSYGFSAIFSSNEAVRNNLRKKILALINHAQTAVAKGDEEEIYQLNIDLFAWSRGLVQ